MYRIPSGPFGHILIANIPFLSMNDLKFTCRQLVKNLGFTAVALLTLALGIAAVTPQLSIFNDVCLHAMPLSEPDRPICIALRIQATPNVHHTPIEHEQS